MKTRTVEEALAECRAAWAAHPEATWAWCLHHEIELEPLTEPIEIRINYILTRKSDDIMKRFDNLRPVLSPFPEPVLQAKAEYHKAEDEYDKAWDEYDKAWDEFDKAWAEYRKAEAELDKARAAWNKAWAELNKARAEFDKAVKAHLPKILKLHSKECGCAWTPNNRNIFSYMPEEEND